MAHGREPSVRHQTAQTRVGLDLQALIIEEVKSLLAGIRTSMASLRTGLMLLVLPLLVVSTIIVTSKHHNLMSVIRHPAAIAICILMVMTGAYLVIKAFFQIRVYHHQIAKIHEKYGTVLGKLNEPDED